MTEARTNPVAADRIAKLLYPLTDFYLSEHRDLPGIEVLEGKRMPEPYRALLVHSKDMTPTLEHFCGREIHLKLLHVRRTPEALYRQVLLVVGDDEWPIEFGAIRIDLTRFTPEAQRVIEAGYVPLGTILRDFAVEHRSDPNAFFSVTPDGVIAAAFGMDDRAATLYGRHNVIRNERGESLAEVVEILPPLHDKKHHFGKESDD